MPLIQTENLTKVYGQGDAAITALDHVSLSVEAGECVAVMGPSGCAKSRKSGATPSSWSHMIHASPPMRIASSTSRTARL